jgi:hypothetical protein
MTDDFTGFTTEQIASARKRVRREKAFYLHLFIYVAVISGLAAINLLSTPHILWFILPAAGWGIGIAAHAGAVFSGRYGWGSEWETRKMRDLLERDATRATPRG